MPKETLPAPGLGTSGIDDHDECVQTVLRALDLGYRHIDTAQMYDNEAAVGDAIQQSEIDREEVFLTTKVHPDNLAPEDVRTTTRESLDRLGVEQVDLLYVHWPIKAYEPTGTLAAFDELVASGVTRHVGLSNFTPDLLAEAIDLLNAPVFAHQVECHPLLQQDHLRELAHEHDHDLVAYAPVMQGNADEVPELVTSAETHGVTPHQVSLAWLLSLDRVVPIPQGRGEHVDQNWAAREITLDEAELEEIAAISEERRLVDPDAAAWNR